MVTEPLYFVHISDTHLGPTREFSRHGHYPWPCAQRLVETINALPTRPDFVIHTGDVVTEPDPACFRLAAELFAGLAYPIYFIAGNHDSNQGLRHFLPMAEKVEMLAESGPLAYAFERKGYRFLALDAVGPPEIAARGRLSESQVALVRREATGDGPPLTIFVHFPALPLNSPWMDANMLIENGLELHRALLPARDRLRAVFYGHVHQPMQTFRDGILYASGASAFAQLTAWPTDEDVYEDREHLPGFQFVHLLPEQTIIHQHTFPRPPAP
jgi:3',5'-cyclic AMP phosphodiesterase CpdA